MAIKWWVNNVSATGSNFLRLAEGSAPADSDTLSTFSVVSLAPAEQAAGPFGRDTTVNGFAGTIDPPTAPSNVAASNAWRTENKYSGAFAAGFWTVFPGMIVSGADGWWDTSIYTGTNPTGSGAVLAASGGGDQGITVPVFSVNNEYIFVSAAWHARQDGAASAAVSHTLHVGSTSGTYVITTDLVQPVGIVIARGPALRGRPGPVSRFRSPQAFLGPPPPADPGSTSFRTFQAPRRFGPASPVSRFRSLPAYPAPSTGTLFTQAVDGTLAIAGALLKSTTKVLAGTLATAGALVKLTQRALDGTLTSAGALVKRAGKVLAGTLTSSGALTAIRTVLVSLAGTLSTAGTLLKQTGKPLAGTLTSAGALVRQAQKTLAGTLSSAGALLKRTGKILAGALTSSGALAASKVALKALAGTLSMSGALARLPNKALAGTLTSSGTLVRQIRHLVDGTLAAAGTLTKRTARALSGVLSFLGGLVGFTGAPPVFGPAMFGRQDAAGLIGKQDAAALAGKDDVAGVSGKQDAPAIAGKQDQAAAKGTVS